VSEVEIKLQVHPPALPAVRAAMHRGRCATTRLRAIYFDTPEQSLARAGWALRLRLEGRRWVQTLKGPADGVLSRIEHEVVLSTAARVPPALDIARHAPCEGFDAFTNALGEGAAALVPVFETDVRRTHRIVRSAGAAVELALDVGSVVCGEARAPVCELEFELKGGAVTALTELAGRWAGRHGLWIDTQTKAERGWLLARGQSSAPATMAQAPTLDAKMSPDAALRASVRAVLAQVLPNASALAAGRHGAEHVHQLRVGLRRLRSIWREFGAWSPALDAALVERTALWFKALGGTRDVDALAASLLPQLRQAAGAPPLVLPAADAPFEPGALFRDPGTTRDLLALLAFAHGAADANADAPTDLRAMAAPALARLHRRLRRAGKAFDTLDDEARHRARKQLKRLRYAAECLSSLWPDKPWADYLRRLKKAQDALGAFQDLTLAQAVFEARRESDARAWFALGWIAARRPEAIERAGNGLRALGRTPKFLR
jgi:triphosphatase